MRPYTVTNSEFEDSFLKATDHKHSTSLHFPRHLQTIVNAKLAGTVPVTAGL